MERTNVRKIFRVNLRDQTNLNDQITAMLCSLCLPSEPESAPCPVSAACWLGAAAWGLSFQSVGLSVRGPSQTHGPTDPLNTDDIAVVLLECFRVDHLAIMGQRHPQRQRRVGLGVF